MISLNCPSSGSIQKIPCNLLAFSSFTFSIAHFCFSLRFDASDISFQISGQKVSGLEVVCSCGEVEDVVGALTPVLSGVVQVFHELLVELRLLLVAEVEEGNRQEEG